MLLFCLQLPTIPWKIICKNGIGLTMINYWTPREWKRCFDRSFIFYKDSYLFKFVESVVQWSSRILFRKCKSFSIKAFNQILETTWFDLNKQIWVYFHTRTNSSLQNFTKHCVLFGIQWNLFICEEKVWCFNHFFKVPDWEIDLW